MAPLIVKLATICSQICLGRPVMIHERFTFKATIKTLIDIVAGKVVDASDDGPLDHVLEPSSIGGRAR